MVIGLLLFLCEIAGDYVVYSYCLTYSRRDPTPTHARAAFTFRVRGTHAHAAGRGGSNFELGI